MSNISFAKVEGAGSSAPVTSAEVVPPAGTPPAPTGNNSPAIPPRHVSTFSTGAEDDEGGDEIAKVRRPYLNLVQPTSKDIKNIAAEGDFVLAKTVKIPSGTQIVCLGFGKTFYREKVKWGTEGRTLYSLEDVIKGGGTQSWNESLENARKNGGSNKPWFAPCIKTLLLVEKPEGADEAFFPHVVGNRTFAACLFEAKSTAYDSFYIELNSKRKTTNLFKSGWAGRFIALRSRKGAGEDASFKPVPEVLGATTDEFIALAKSIASES